MKLVQNSKTLISHPKIAYKYLLYLGSKLKNSSQAIKVFPNRIKCTGFSGFSEYYTCEQYANNTERKFLQNYPLDSGDLIDVGANLGIITATLAQRFPERLVHAFEPNPFTFPSLQTNIAINNLTNVKAQQCALGKYNGEVFFRADPINRATCSLATSEDYDTISLPCITLDYYVKQQSIKQIAFLKVDVEGYEALVFQGAQEILKRQLVSIIYYEVCPSLTSKAGFDPKFATHLLLSSGYHIKAITSQGDLTSVSLDSIQQVNLENWIAIRP